MDSDQARDAARLAKRELVQAIRDAKEAAWTELLEFVDTDPWGKPYRLVMSKLGARRPIPGIHLPGRVEAIVDGLFPTHPT